MQRECMPAADSSLRTTSLLFRKYNHEKSIPYDAIRIQRSHRWMW